MAKHGKWGKTAAIIAAAVGGVAALGIWGVSTVTSRLSDASRTAIQTIEVSDGTIESTIAGTGTLEYLDSENVTVPSGLDIDSVLLTQGAQASAGEVLATVSRSSCEARMSEVYDEISDTEQKLADMPDSTKVVDVRAPAAGTVAQVNATAGSSVVDTLASSGALAVISSGSGTAADISTDTDAAFIPGSTLLIGLSDGAEVSATIRSTDTGSLTVELSDASVGTGQHVTAFTPEGERIGEGMTVPLNATDVVGPAGTIESVKVTAGTSVAAGDVLFTVRTSGKSAEKTALEQTRTSLTSEYDQLALIIKDGGITAPISGTIVSCAVSAGQNTSDLEPASGSSSGGTVRIPSSASDVLSMFGAGMSAPTGEGQDIMLSAAAEEPAHTDVLPGADLPPEFPIETPDSIDPPVRTQEPSGAQSHAPSSEASAAATPALRGIPRVEVPLVPPIAGFPLQTELAVCPVYTGSVVWDPADVQAQHATVYTAHVTLRAETGFTFNSDCTATVLNGTPEDLRSDGHTLTFTVTYPETAPVIDLPDIDWDAIQEFLNAGGSLDMSGLRDLLASGLMSASDLGIDLADLTSQLDPSALYGQIDPSVFAGALDSGSLAGMDPSILSGGGLYADPSASGQVYDPVAYTIAPDHSMKLVIRINQMDILSVSAGMHCTVTVDAIPDTEFEGTVDYVSQTVSGDGDYTAEIVIPRDDRMRPGMTASATIVTQETSGVLALPVAALQEDGNRVFVYTEYDEGKDEFSGETDVETGVSNGNEVEIISGLEPGQVVYYRGSDGLRDFMRMMGGDDHDNEAEPTYIPPDQAIATP